MTTLSSDSPLTLPEAAQACPQLRGRRLHTSTIWRWMRRGCKARNGETIRLAHRRVGGTITTTKQDLDRFFAALAEADLESFRRRDSDVEAAPETQRIRPVQPDAAVRHAQIERAQRVLDDAGI